MNLRRLSDTLRLTFDRGQKSTPHRNHFRPTLERLEDRVVPTTYTVTNTLASGTGSLAAAVQSANANTTSASLINFDSTVFATPQTITLTSTLNLTNTSKPVTIQGPSNVGVTISGNQQIQDFVINTSGVVATIQNLTIANGNAGGNSGGGLSIGGGTVTIDHCTITNGIASSGGGINVTGVSNVLIENSAITGNTATGWGGGVAINGDSAFMTLIGCTISNNALANNGQNGGGISIGGGSSYISQGFASIINCTITGNSANNAYWGGGGIGTSGGNFLVEGCTITGNSAVNTTNGYGGAGGGIRCDYYYSMTLLNNLIWNNTANAAPDLGDGGYNTPTINYCLVGSTIDAVIPPNSVGNIFGVAPNAAILGTLGNNGGPTQTFLPVAGSFPVGAGSSVTTANAAVTSTAAATLTVAYGRAFAAASLTPQLSFVTQPTNTTAGATINPVTVQVTRPVDLEEYIQIDNEVMAIVGATVNSDGSATLNVERGVNGTTPTTHAANSPIYLVSDQRGQVIPGAASVPAIDIGAVQSAAVTPAAGAGLALTMGISSGNLNGTTTALTNAAGQAVFDNLSAPATGTYQLKLAGGLATSNSFSVATGTFPIVSSLSPPSGIAGASLTITGSNLTGATAVSFGSVPASSFTVNSATSITATIPSGIGIVDVTVTTSVGTSAIAGGDKFSYASVVTGVSPSSGSVNGGTSVTITGANFSGVTAVKFGGANAASFAINSATSITAIAPAGTRVVDISVTNPGGASAFVAADRFSYNTGSAAFVVSNLAATGPGSLFFAVQGANANTLTRSVITFDSAAFASPTTITLPFSITLSNATQPILIQGPAGVAITLSGNRQAGRKMRDCIITAGTAATIQNLIIADADTGTGDGGGFYAINGDLTIDHCTISNNVANAGGGVAAAGSAVVLLKDSTLTANTATYGGGAIVIYGGVATVTVIGCLLTNNSALSNGAGGGAVMSNSTSPITVINSTIKGNTCYGGYYGGGGFYVANGNLILIGSTVTGNTSVGGTGGGLFNGYPSSTVTLINDILWNNTATEHHDIYTGMNGALINISYTLIGDPNGIYNATYGSGNNIGVATTPAILGPLADNGGPTQTCATVPGSPPIGTGGAVTTISVGFTNTTTTTLAVANLSRLAAAPLPTISSGSYYILQIGSEQMAVTGAGTSTLTVVRGINGTTAATHASGASVYLVSDQRAYLVPANNPPVVDMGAFQSTGINERPTITAIDPNTGSVGGGTAVTITGTNFTGTTAVFFGSIAATSFTVNSNTQITAAAPAESSGTVDISVAGPLGTSGQSTADQFTYFAATTTSFTDNGPNPSTFGDAVSFTATVSGGSAIDGQTVTIEDASNANAVVASPTLSGGTVSFTISDLTIGTHDLFAVYSGDATHAGSNSSLAPVTQVVNGIVPTVSSVVVNGGDAAYIDSQGGSVSLAGQNSVVEQVLVTFNEAVTLAPGAFTIANNSDKVTVISGAAPNALPVTAVWGAPVAGSGNTQWIVRFSGPGTTALAYGGVGNVIKDGLYTLNINAADVTAMVGGQSMADSVNTGFWAMFGAVHNNVLSGTIGDGGSEVFLDCCDFNEFATAFTADSTNAYAPPYYDVAMDFDLDGFVDADTFNAFVNNFNNDWTF